MIAPRGRGPLRRHMIDDSSSSRRTAGPPRARRRRTSDSADPTSGDLSRTSAAAWAMFPDDVFETDLDERIIFANHGLMNRSPEELVGNALSGFLPVEHRRAFRETCILAQKTGQEHSCEAGAVHGPPWWLYRVIPLVGADKKPERLLVVRTNITAQKQDAEHAIEEANRYRLAFDSAKAGMAVTSVDGHFLLVNQALCDMLGYTMAELLETDIYGVTHPDDLAESATQARNLLMGKADSVVVEKRYFHKNGNVVWCRVCAAAATDEEGTTQYFVTQVQDISNVRLDEGSRQRHERQALEKGRLDSLQDVAGNVAEELDPLLHELLDFATELGDRVGPGHAAEPIIESLREAVEQRAGFVRQLLTLSRRQALEPTSVDLNKFLAEFAHDLPGTIGERVELRITLAHDLPRVKCDPFQIEAALSSLIGNAIEAMPSGGELILETGAIRLGQAHCRENPGSKPGDYVQITVSDTGTGMDLETQRRVLDPFFTTKPRRHHRGLGLSTASAIAQQHGGSVTIYSEVGRGTSCRLFLPIEESRRDTPMPPTAKPVGRETILLAEDEEALSSVARRILERLGYHVLTAVDGAEALHMFVAGRDNIDLVLLDMTMPRMGGVEAFDRIRAIDREVPIAFMTGYSAEMALESFSQSGAVLIPKPYGMDELGETVREMLDARYNNPEEAE